MLALAPADEAAAVLLLNVLSSGMPMGWGAASARLALLFEDDAGVRCCCRLSVPLALPVVAPAAAGADEEVSTPAPLLALDLRAPLLLDLSFLLAVDPPALADPPLLLLVCAAPPADDDAALPADGDALLLPPRSDFQNGIPDTALAGDDDGDVHAGRYRHYRYRCAVLVL